MFVNRRFEELEQLCFWRWVRYIKLGDLVFSVRAVVMARSYPIQVLSSDDGAAEDWQKVSMPDHGLVIVLHGAHFRSDL